FPFLAVLAQGEIFAFVEYFDPVFPAGTYSTLFFFWQVMFFYTGIATATVILSSTSGTLDEQQVAAVIFTVGMHVAGLPALVALGNDIVGDALTQALVKHKVFSDKLQGQVLLL